MVHYLITDKENYCALRPHRMGIRTTDSGFYSQFMLLLPPHRMGVRTTDGDI